MLVPLDIEFQCRFWQKVKKTDSCWIWIGARILHGYGLFWCYGARYLTHRLSYYWHYNKDPGDLFVMHLCNNPSCVNPNHLLLGTNGDNSQHAFDCGRNNKKGINASMSKLTEDDVRFIRQSSLNGPELAKRFNVTKECIYHIKSRRRWQHVN